MRRSCSTSPASRSTPTTAAAWQHPLTGGLILFARNWRDRRQLTELTAEIKSMRPDLLICVDHEGGRVQRFRSDGFTHLPPMRVLGEMWMNDGALARRPMRADAPAGYVLGAELRACGVDLSFTPVLDLDHGAQQRDRRPRVPPRPARRRRCSPRA